MSKRQLIDHFKPYFDVLKCPDVYCWVAGGAIVSTLTNTPVNDLDIYFDTNDNRVKTVNKLYELGAIKVKSLRLGEKLLYNNQEYDLLFLGNDPKETINNFDYTICCAAFDIDEQLYHHPDFFKDLEDRRIVYTGNNTTYISHNKAKRLVKYVGRGYSIDDTNIHALFKDSE